MEMSDEYYRACLTKIPMITKVGRIKGKSGRNGVKKWTSHGLTVVIDDKNFTMVATYQKKLVAASLRCRCEFTDGDWFNIVLWNQMEIEEIERKENAEQCRETINRLMKRGEN